MGFYDDESNVNEYVRSAEGFDGRVAITRLREYLDPGSAVLELGMGPGTDLGILAETYQVTGSDTSEVFLRRYREKHPEAEVFNLDAVTININRTFDCVYSNKVLYHLSPVDLRASLERQRAVLREEGLSVTTTCCLRTTPRQSSRTSPRPTLSRSLWSATRRWRTATQFS
jgi:ubiquinone/menaquinone biosynthesis C-methylase UbiE